MSQIKLKHSGGNGVIIAAPSSNPAADRTLTLPGDANGELLTNVSRKGFFARQTSTTSIPNTTYTKVTNLTTDSITQNLGSSFADSRFTVATGQEGVYFMFGSVAIDDIQILDVVRIKFSVNGTLQTLFHEERAQFQNGSTPNVIVGTGLFGHMINLSVGDYVELFVYHNEGSTEPTEEDRTFFGGFRI